MDGFAKSICRGCDLGVRSFALLLVTLMDEYGSIGVGEGELEYNNHPHTVSEYSLEIV